MNLRRACWNLLWLIPFGMIASQNYGDVRFTPKVIIPPEGRVAAASGEEYEGVIELTAGHSGLLERVEISGEGWTILSVTPSGDIDLVAGESVKIIYRALPVNADNELRATFIFDGKTTTKKFNVGPERMARIGKPRLSTSSHPPLVIQNVPIIPDSNAEGSVAGGAITLRVKGRIVYWRPGDMPNAPVGVDNIPFSIMDEDDVSDELMYYGLTNSDGTFDVTFQWDDCDISGCDDPDIYIEYETDSGVVNVQDTDLLETDYTWSTDNNVFEDFTGGLLDFGNLWPSDSNDYPALHIYTSIIRTYKFILEHDGTDVEELDVLWPEDNDGAFYNPDFEEIHIGPNRQWNEVTHAHEYGHHFMENYSVNTEPDYCNLTCDCEPNACEDPEDCGHCLWCAETDHDAWNEGWPNWLGSAVCRRIPADYGVTPWAAANDTRCLDDSLQPCSGMTFADALRTEGFAFALLRDIEDPNPTWDDHDTSPLSDCDGNGTADCGDADGDNMPDDGLPHLDCDDDGLPDCDCDVDAMAMGYDEIFRIVREDQPTTPLQFIAAFRDRYPEQDQDLWSTTRNVSAAYGFPLLTPQITSPPQDCATGRAGEFFSISVTGNGSLLRYQWRRDGVNLADTPRITGTRSHTLLFNPLLAGDEGSYSVMVSTCDGTLSTISSPIRVTVFSASGGGAPGIMWGLEFDGELGQGIFVPGGFSPPSSIVAVNDFTQVAPGSYGHTLGLKSDGTVWAWGNNSYYQLGTMVITHSATPVMVAGLTDIVAVDASHYASFALGADGRVYSWGSNWGRELGRITPTPIDAIPTAIPDLECVVEINAGPYSIMAIKSDGTVWGWGSNENGILGLGYASYPGLQTPTQVPGITDAVNGAVGQTHMLIVRSNGTVMGWGNNLNGAIGDGTNQSRLSPVPTVGIDNVRFVADGKAPHSIAVKSDGTAWGWGGNQNGELGVGSTAIYVNTPMQVIGLENIAHAGMTLYTSAFRRADGTVWVTGSNGAYGLGGTQWPWVVITPIQVASIAGATFVAAGGTKTVVLAPAVPVAITQQPVNRTNVVGQSATFSVTATGTPQIVYQWMRSGFPLANGGAFSGANGGTLTINPVDIGHAGSYTVAVTNAFGSTTSAAAVLTVSEMAGDVNADGNIDELDFAAFVDCFGAPGVPPNPLTPGLNAQVCNAIFDLGNDGDVDIRNFADFQNAFAP